MFCVNTGRAVYLYRLCFGCTWNIRPVCMGWLRLVGSLKLLVFSAEYRLFYRALLQKRPIVVRSLLIVATPYLVFGCLVYRYNMLYCTAYCIWSVISWISNLNRCSSSLGLFYHVPSKRDQGDWDWRLRLNDTTNWIGCTWNIGLVCT